MKHKLIKWSHHFHLLAWQLMPIVIILVVGSSVGYGAILNRSSLNLSSNLPSSTSNYNYTFSIPYSETLGSVEFQICANSPIVTLPCTYPSGFSDSSASLISESGVTGYIISPTSNSNTLILSSAPQTVSAGTLNFVFSGVTNPSSTGSYYVRIQTFASIDGSGPSTDVGGIAYDILNAFTIATYVPPYLLFCDGVSISAYDCNSAAGNYINFGYLSARATTSAQSQFLVATNAQNGYSIEVSGQTLTSGNNVLPPLNSDGGSISGQDQFGINLVTNSQPQIGSYAQGPGAGGPTSSYGEPNLYKFTPGDVIASSNQPSDYLKYTVSYIINVSNAQPPGVYTTTFTLSLIHI